MYNDTHIRRVDKRRRINPPAMTGKLNSVHFSLYEDGDEDQSDNDDDDKYYNDDYNDTYYDGDDDRGRYGDDDRGSYGDNDDIYTAVSFMHSYVL